MSRGLRRILILVAASVISIAGVLYFTVDERTGQALTEVRPLFLPLLFGIWITILILDAGSIMLYGKAADEKIGFFPALRSTTIRVFFNIVTPFAFGGPPFSVISLHREGVPSGKGSSIVIIKLITLAAFSQMGALVSFIFFHDRISNVAALNKVIMISGIAGGGTILLLTFGFLYPQFLVKIITTTSKLLHGIRMVKQPGIIRRKVIMQAATARRSFRRYFSHHLGFFISGTLCNGLVYAAQLVMLWMILLGLGINVTFLTGLVLASMLIFLLAFMPTPGAIGLGEAVFFLLFSRTIPTYMIGIAIVLWRFFFHYLSAILGAVNSSNYLSGILVKKPAT